MGLFSWLFGRRAPSLRISVWLDEPSRLSGLARDVRADLAKGRSVVLVAHFASALVEVGQHFANEGIPFTTLSSWRPLGSTPSVVAILAKALPQPVPGATPVDKRGTEVRIAIRGVELHVLARENDRLVNFAATLPVPCEVCASTSLDAPVLARTQKPWVREMLSKMGFTADAPIDSPMLSRSMKKALVAIEGRARRDLPADSVAQWMDRNVDPL